MQDMSEISDAIIIIIITITIINLSF